MRRVEQYLDLAFNKLTQKNWDNVVAIVADEGRGKSTLGLHMAEYWYKKLRGSCKPEDVKHICLSKEEFVEDLKDCQKYELTVYDEAGDLLSRRAMSNFNVSIMAAYQVIRGDNLFTILILPSLWDLDSFFRKRRLRGFFYVYERGRVAFWNQARLKRMLSLNATRPVKQYFVTKPSFYDTFPKYNGVLAEGYDAKKKAKMQGVRQQLFNEIAGNKADPDVIKKELAVKTAESVGNAKAAEIYGVTTRTICRWKKAVEDTDSGTLSSN